MATELFSFVWMDVFSINNTLNTTSSICWKQEHVMLTNSVILLLKPSQTSIVQLDYILRDRLCDSVAAIVSVTYIV